MELRLVLGDQLNAGHSWFRTPEPAVCYLMAELRQETDYCRHHRQKVLAFFAAMRAFAAALKKAGHRVCYLTLDESARWPDLPSLLEAQLEAHQADSVAWQSPDEWRLASQLKSWAAGLAIPATEVESEHFLTPAMAGSTIPTAGWSSSTAPCESNTGYCSMSTANHLAGAGTLMTRTAPSCRRASRSRHRSPLPTR